MAKRKLLFKEEKYLPGINFLLIFPIRFTGSISKSMQEEFDTYCKQNNKNKSKLLRDELFSFLNVKNENEILSKYPIIRKQIQTEGRLAILDELGLSGSEFSSWLRNKINSIITKQ